MQNYTSKPAFNDTLSLCLANVDILYLALNEKKDNFTPSSVVNIKLPLS